MFLRQAAERLKAGRDRSLPGGVGEGHAVETEGQRSRHELLRQEVLERTQPTATIGPVRPGREDVETRGCLKAGWSAGGGDGRLCIS